MGDIEGDIEAANGQMASVYYTSLGGGVMTPGEVSDAMDGYGWSSSWRVSDADEILWFAEDPGPGSDWWVPGFPMVFIIDTETMIIDETSDPLGDAQALND
jgi:hypothetical protein